MTRPVLPDTCATIWLMNGDRMSAASLEAIGAAQAAGCVQILPITAWEIAMLAAGGRLALTLSPRAWFARVLAQPGVSLAPMPVDVLMASATLPGDVLRDQADRIIAATARELGHVIVTRDAAFVAYAAARHVDVITC